MPSAAVGILPLAVAELRFVCCVVPLQSLSIPIVTSAPETSCGLLAVDPDVAKTLAVLALCQTILDLDFVMLEE
jgi:hypothetical protein